MKPMTARPRPKAKTPVKLHAATAARRASSRQSIEDTSYDDEFEPSMKLSRAFVIVLVMHVVAVGGIFAFNAIKTKQLSEARSEDALEKAAKSANSDTEAAALVKAAATPAAPSIAASRRHVVRSGETPYKIAQNYGVRVEDLLAVNYLKENAIIVPGQELRVPDATVAAPTTVANTKAAAQPPAAPRPTPAPAASAAPKQPASTPAAPVDSDMKSLLGVTDAPKPPSSSKNSTGAVSGSGSTYTVGKGDNPYNIAKKLGVDYNDLLKLNNIDDPRKLQIGQQLKVPAKHN